MENTNENNNKTTKFLIIFLGLFSILSIIYIATANDGLASEATEKAYNLQLTSTERAVNQAKNAVEALCKIEADHANAKLADHYAGKKQLTQNDLDRLALKSQSVSLNCRDF
jgi:acetyl-CoA carboxylase carboxyltransferase component